MNDIIAAIDTLFARVGPDADAWPALVESGFAHVGLPLTHGGSGGDLADAALILERTAYHCADVPLAESTWLAGWLATQSGLAVTSGTATAAAGDLRVTNGRATGRLTRVPALGKATDLYVATPEAVVRLNPGDGVIQQGVNVAGEDRSDIEFADVEVIERGPAVPPGHVMRRGALARAVQIAGAASKALELSLRYAAEREQFGRPIGKFQAVQHLLAAMASEVFLARSATQAALAAPASPMAVASAKLNAARAASVVARHAHQVHGAMGVTLEHDLHKSSLRLRSWALEFGGPGYWADAIERMAPPDGLWAWVVETAQGEKVSA